jgi:hypothetical protein
MLPSTASADSNIVFFADTNKMNHSQVDVECKCSATKDAILVSGEGHWTCCTMPAAFMECFLLCEAIKSISPS